MQRPTNAQIQTILAKTAGNLKPYELQMLETALSKTSAVRGPLDDEGKAEATLATTFPSGSIQW